MNQEMAHHKPPDLPCFNVETGIQRLREIGMLPWTCHFRPTHRYWEGPEIILLTSTLGNKFVRGSLVSLKSSVITLLHRPDLTAETTVTQLKNLNTMGVIGSWGARS